MKHLLTAALLLLPVAAGAQQAHFNCTMNGDGFQCERQRLPFPRTGLFHAPEPEVVRAPAPQVELPPDTSPRGFLETALGAMDRGDYDAAQQILEQFETRHLSRSVPLYRTDEPVHGWVIDRVRMVRGALGDHLYHQARRGLRELLASLPPEGER